MFHAKFERILKKMILKTWFLEKKNKKKNKSTIYQIKKLNLIQIQSDRNKIS